ncbi:response regulator [Paenibacillus sp. IB182496]|uniref:Response regulator n=2 Tax=Paenibacillus sabuli TaxID=2772509 RepID=A0A927GS94_9BACL|nr:response regulator [Paenibacillus sabuli]
MTIDWASLGVAVVGEAYDGEHALELAQRERAELVLSDIRMDGIDGLQLAERLRQVSPDTRIVMLSGYEDFEYARQAVRLGVEDYLLKPVDIDELSDVVRRVVADIRKEALGGVREEDLLWLAGIVRGAPSKAAPPGRSHWHGAAFRIVGSQLASFADSYAKLSADDNEALHERWEAAVRGTLVERGLRALSVFDHPNLMFTLIIIDRRQDDAWWQELLEAVAASWPGAEPLYCALSEAFERLEDTAAAADHARLLLQYYALERRPVLLPSEPAPQREEQGEPLDEQDWVQRMVAALYQQDAEAVRTELDGLFASLEGRRLLLHEAVSVYIELMVVLRRRLRRSGLEEVERAQRPVIDLLLHNSYDSVRELAVSEALQLMELVESSGLDKSYWVVEKAVKYMRERSTSDLKASEVAAWLKITPSYFSFLFKQGTGRSFTEYMNELRINQAKELLATTPDKVFEIADRVGYREYKYFVSVFKSVTGMTPKEYRTRMAGR